jgi:hypothetical protein
MGLFIDAGHDRLYMADGVGDVFVFDTASLKSGPPSVSDRTVILPLAAKRIAVDTTNDRLYAAGTAVHIVPGISTATGAVSATAALFRRSGEARIAWWIACGPGFMPCAGRRTARSGSTPCRCLLG